MTEKFLYNTILKDFDVSAEDKTFNGAFYGDTS